MSDVLSYRREIDGMRALAVAAVVIFHADLSIGSLTVAGSGYLGVDIFLVISGYLITRIILDGLQKGTFSIRDFYERRCRRILPALFVVVLASLPAAWLLMLPGPMKEFSASALSSLFFVSNIYFWRTDGYFAEAVRYQPLLHTWSLSLEEQFYILFPVFTLLLFKVFKANIYFFYVVFFIIGVIFSEIATSMHPSASFYLLPTRAFELLAGSSIAALEFRRSRPTPSTATRL